MSFREDGTAILPKPRLALVRPDREIDGQGPSSPPHPKHTKDSHRHGWTTRYVVSLGVTDLAVAALVLSVAHLVIGLGSGLTSAWLIASVVAWPIAIAAAGGYSRTSIGVGTSDIGAVMRAMLYLIVAGAVAVAVDAADGIIGLLVLSVPAMAALAMIARFVSRKVVHHQQHNGMLMREVAVVGPLSGVLQLISVLEREPHCGLRGIGVCVPRDEVAAAQSAGLTVFGDLDHVAQSVAAAGCDGIAVTAAQQPDFLRKLAWSLEGYNIDLLVHPGLVEVTGPRMHLRPYVGLPLLQIEHPHFSGWRRVVKRVTDVALTSIGLILAAPFMLTVAALIKLTDHGPVFFTQTRVGLDGREFTMYKFRSMVVDAEAKLKELEAQNEGAGLLFKMKNDPRITRVGRFLRKYSMDELPQLFNVLVGDMSLVGPRPPLPREVDAYATDVHRRLLVQPGLTGLWQVSGRSLLSWEESVRLDLRYVENWCLSMDLLLLWKTVWAVLAKRGAF